MFKKRFFYTLITLIFFCFQRVQCQNILEKHILRNYTNSEARSNTTTQFTLILLSQNTDKETRNDIRVIAIRSFTEDMYLVESNLIDESIKNNIGCRFYSIENNYWKLSDKMDVLRKDELRHTKIYKFNVIFKSQEYANTFLRLHPYKYNVTSILKDLHILSINSNYKEVSQLFLNDDEILSIDFNLQSPKEELAVNGFDLSANKLNVVHNTYPDINGSGQHVSLKENYYDTADIDLKGRLENSPLASNSLSNHANAMATIIAGAGNSVYYAKGAAWGSIISSSAFDQLLPDPSSYYTQYNITVQNHSYGADIDNTYGINALAFDKSTNDNKILSHVFSSGNSGTSSSTSGKYSGIPGFANITGNFKMAKNVLVVGGVDSFGIVAPLSSRGPAYDGRIKPDIVSFQMNGTSESAALVSGTLLLLQQYFLNKNKTPLPSALAKAILINGADDVNNPGPDYATGFGNLNAIKSMDIIKNNTILSGQITKGTTQSFSINIPTNISKLKVTLTWNDTTSSAFSPKALVNDLDLSVSLPATSEAWKPWVLSTFPNADSLNALSQRKRDSLNNEELVTIENPQSGTYNINVVGYDLPIGSQKYFVTYSMDTVNYFKWDRPGNQDFLEGGKSNIIRWEASNLQKGDLEYSYSGIAAWKPIALNIDVSKNSFYWMVPDTLSKILLRMKAGNTYYYSDTFFITHLLSPKVGLVCPDSILIYWENIKNVNQYQLYTLGDRYMQPFIQVNDTSVLIRRNLLLNNFLAVGPIFQNSLAPKSYAFDYTLQGAGCYINSFFADLQGNSAMLDLNLGTTYNVKSISFEKLTRDGYITIDSINVINGLVYNYLSINLKDGITYFRSKLLLANGKVIYSNSVSVLYVTPGKYLVFPSPVRKNENIQILSPIPEEQLFQIIDAMGRIIIQKKIQSVLETITTSGLESGPYYYRILKEGLSVSHGKIIIL